MIQKCNVFNCITEINLYKMTEKIAEYLIENREDIVPMLYNARKGELADEIYLELIEE